MKTLSRALGLAVVTVVLATSSGCSIIDRLFLLNTDGPHGHHAGHGAGPCQDGMCEPGQCGPEGCPTGNCQPGGACHDCEGGACHPRHVGRYGGLAKHHLTPEEKAALAGSGYGSTQPPGPPTGASRIRTTPPAAREISSPSARPRSGRSSAGSASDGAHADGVGRRRRLPVGFRA